jgi:hypothetical protein
MSKYQMVYRRGEVKFHVILDHGNYIKRKVLTLRSLFGGITQSNDWMDDAGGGQARTGLAHLRTSWSDELRHFYIYINQISYSTDWSTELKFPYFYGTRWSITVFIRHRHWTPSQLHPAHSFTASSSTVILQPQPRFSCCLFP